MFVFSSSSFVIEQTIYDRGHLFSIPVWIAIHNRRSSTLLFWWFACATKWNVFENCTRALMALVCFFHHSIDGSTFCLLVYLIKILAATEFFYTTGNTRTAVELLKDFFSCGSIVKYRAIQFTINSTQIT